MDTAAPADDDVVIVGAARTPIGSFGGGLASVSAVELGAIAIKGALKKAGVPPSEVQTCYMGNVLSAGVGQGPARQAALRAGLPYSTTCTTVNKVCASGLKAISLASQEIQVGDADVAVAGGMENMSQTPYYLPHARFGHRLGNFELVDGLVHDGLTDAQKKQHMGSFADQCARKHAITREEQDRFARRSYERAKAAWDEGQFRGEVEPVTTAVRGKTAIVERDEECFRHDPATFTAMTPVFDRDAGTVTRGNASGLNDGAAAVVLMRARKARELGIETLATVRGCADAEQQPEDFPTTPAEAIPVALRRARIDLAQVDAFEINEAFAVATLATIKLLSVSEDEVNLNGGAVSLGHPIGCSGARIVVTLVNVLRSRSLSIGVASVCNGGGGASALVLERSTKVVSKI